MANLYPLHSSTDVQREREREKERERYRERERDEGTKNEIKSIVICERCFPALFYG